MEADQAPTIGRCDRFIPAQRIAVADAFEVLARKKKQICPGPRITSQAQVPWGPFTREQDRRAGPGRLYAADLAMPRGKEWRALGEGSIMLKKAPCCLATEQLGSDALKAP